jgi:hypothetical protein
MRLAKILGLIVAVLMLSATDLRAERRVALVIGNGAYQNAPPLSNPVNDARAMADLFRKAGFDVVEERENLGSLDIKRAIRDFTAKTRNADIAVIYFAGHGIEVSGTNYLVPVDARLANDFDAEDEALALDRVVRALEPARRLRLVILDACRDNPFVRSMQRTIATRAVPGGLAKVEPTSSDTLIAFAAKAGSTAADGDGEHSPFTAALLKNLAQPGLDVRLALGRVRDDVLKDTGNRQEPYVYGSLGGATVALVPEPQRAAPADVSSHDIRRDYELAERVGTAEAWDSFLAVYKTGFYADLARAARAKLAAVSPEAPTPSTPDPATLARDLQAELKRVGCDPGPADGKWSAKSRQALSLFNRHAGTSFDVKVASLGALEAVRAKDTRVCPLACGAGSRREGDTCVAIPAPGIPAPKSQAARPPQPDRALRERPAAREIRRNETSRAA